MPVPGRPHFTTSVSCSGVRWVARSDSALPPYPWSPDASHLWQYWHTALFLKISLPNSSTRASSAVGAVWALTGVPPVRGPMQVATATTDMHQPARAPTFFRAVPIIRRLPVLFLSCFTTKMRGPGVFARTLRHLQHFQAASQAGRRFARHQVIEGGLGG